MSRTEQAQDSSMEEILASIRRIISEDASQGKPANPEPAWATAPGPGRPQAGALRMPAKDPIVKPTPSPAPPFVTSPPFATAVPQPAVDSEDDILDLGATYASVTRSPSPPVRNFGFDGARRTDFAPLTEPVTDAARPVLDAKAAAGVELAGFTRLQPLPQSRIEPTFEATPAPVAVALPEAAGPRPEAALASEDGQPAAAELPAPDGPGLFVLDAAVAPPYSLSIVQPLLSESPAAEPVVEVVSVAEPPIVDASSAAIGDAELPLHAEPVAVMPEISALAALPVAAEVPVPTIAAAAPVFAVTVLAAEPPAKRTLEDAVADMLKPMLQDWLNKNMPTIIEKAMAKE